jgi:hypothetical protein
LPKKPFLGMNGECVNATRHGGTAYGFGKETKEAAAKGSKARRLHEAVSHTRDLEASPRRHVAPLASLALADSTFGHGLGVDDVCLRRLSGRAIRVGSCGGGGIATKAPPTRENCTGFREGVGATADVVVATGCRGGSSAIARVIGSPLDDEWLCRAGL